MSVEEIQCELIVRLGSSEILDLTAITVSDGAEQLLRSVYDEGWDKNKNFLIADFLTGPYFPAVDISLKPEIKRKRRAREDLTLAYKVSTVSDKIYIYYDAGGSTVSLMTQSEWQANDRARSAFPVLPQKPRLRRTPAAGSLAP